VTWFFHPPISMGCPQEKMLLPHVDFVADSAHGIFMRAVIMVNELVAAAFR
jgi:hypothetical protein